MTALADADHFSPRTLVNSLRLAGISVTAQGDRIRWKRMAGTSAITVDQADQIRRHRGKVLELLHREGPEHEQRLGVDGWPSWASWESYWVLDGWKL